MTRPPGSTGVCLVVANVGDDDPGFVGERVTERGLSLRVCHRERSGSWGEGDPSINGMLEGVTTVVLLGSEWSVYWPSFEAEVRAETALVRAALGRALPVLGICFGSQLLARALGGVVQRAPRGELGWLPVRTDRPEVVTEGPWAQWHHDRVLLPPGAVELARSEVCTQAWMLGGALGVQFHPEATPDILDRWSLGDCGDLAEAGQTREGLWCRSVDEAPRARSDAYRLVDFVLDELSPPCLEAFDQG